MFTKTTFLTSHSLIRLPTF